MHDVQISPSILAADLTCLEDEIARAVEGGCDDIHIDIMDAHFVPNLSFGPRMVETVRTFTDLPLDVHLMMDNPRDMIGAFAAAGSSFITVHVEVLDDVPGTLAAISNLGIRPGLSLKPDTPVDMVIPYLSLVDILLVMSVFPGFGGQDFIEESYGRIREVSRAANLLPSPPLISVDGGIGFENAPLLVKAGANHLVSGTTIFREHHAEENIRHLREVLTRIRG